MAFGAKQIVEGVPRTPAQFGLFSVLTFRQPGDVHWQNGIGWQSPSCTALSGIGDPSCATEAATYPDWAAATAYAVGERAQLDAVGEDPPVVLEVTVAGTSGATAPAAPGLGNTVVDGDPGDPAAVPPVPSTAVTWTQVAAEQVPVPTPGIPKNLDDSPTDTSEASPFTVYAPFECSPVGNTPASAQDYATGKLQAGEENAVERAFWTGYLGNSPSLGVPSTLGSATAETIATGLTPAEALAALEQYAAENYNGSQGVIHLTRAAALIMAAASLIVRSGNSLSTALGTPVVAGTGYAGTGPDGAAPADGQAWAYVTPQLFGYRSEIFTSTNRAGDLLDRATNDLYAIAERTYLLAFDPCGVGAVSLVVTSTTGA